MSEFCKMPFIMLKKNPYYKAFILFCFTRIKAHFNKIELILCDFLLYFRPPYPLFYLSIIKSLGSLDFRGINWCFAVHTAVTDVKILM